MEKAGVDAILAASPSNVFYVSDYYRFWRVLSDDEGLGCLKEWRLRRSGINLDMTGPR